MTNDLALFGDDEASAPVEPSSQPSLVANWQVDLLRKALDRRGLTSMADRQKSIEAAAGRSVESLRTLTHDEAMAVLTRLGPAPASDRPPSSSWGDRDEDTWIDRL